MVPVSQNVKKNKQYDVKYIYSQSQITKTIMLPFSAIGKNIHQTLEQTIASMVEGKCIVEGFVKYNSVKILTFSSGIIKGDNVLFDVVFNCEVCFPVAGMGLNCIVKNITKAGIRAESSEEDSSPFVLFIARDHYFASDYFNSIELNEKIVARVIAQRFELNDKYVSVVAELVPPRGDLNKDKKPRLIL
jgi:DNA-directed RNA polymerase subunit E'/Rpb7